MWDQPLTTQRNIYFLSENRTFEPIDREVLEPVATSIVSYQICKKVTANEYTQALIYVQLGGGCSTTHPDRLWGFTNAGRRDYNQQLGWCLSSQVLLPT